MEEAPGSQGGNSYDISLCIVGVELASNSILNNMDPARQA